MPFDRCVKRSLNRSPRSVSADDQKMALTWKRRRCHSPRAACGRVRRPPRIAQTPLSGDRLRGKTYSNPARAPAMQELKQSLRAPNARGEDDVDGSNRRRTEKRTTKGHMRVELSP